MISTYSVLLQVMAGLCAYAAIHNLIIGTRHGRVHYLFALACVAIACMNISGSLSQTATTASGLVEARRWQFISASLFSIAFVYFCAEYTGIKNRTLLALFTLVWLCILAVVALLPYGVVYASLPEITYQTLPWGELKVETRPENPTVYWKIAWIAIFITMLYCFYLGIRFRSGNRHKGSMLAYAVAVLFVFAFFNHIVNLRLFEFVHTADFGIIALIMMMDLDLLRRIKEEDARTREVLDHLPVAVCTKSEDGKYQFCNAAFDSYFESRAGHGQFTSDKDIFPPALRASLRERELLALQTGEESRFEFTVEAQGKPRYFEAYYFPIHTPGSRESVTCALYVDVTEARTQELALQKLKNQSWFTDRVSNTASVAKSLAHELSQPLSAILSNAQAGLRFIRNGDVAADSEEMIGILEDIVRDEKRAGAVINSLRALLQQKQTPAEHVDIGEIVAELVALLRSELLFRNVKIQIDASPGTVVTANKIQLQQVLLNLITNAAEAMEESPPADRSLTISVTKTGDDALITVSDTGPGIPEEMLDAVFDGFYTTKAQGMGVGLEICRSIMETHMGKIWVKNNPERGATFYCRLPIAP